MVRSAKIGHFGVSQETTFYLSSKLAGKRKGVATCHFFLIGALDYKERLVYVFIRLKCNLACYFDFLILSDDVAYYSVRKCYGTVLTLKLG